MKHQQAIFQQRLENMKIGLKQTDSYLVGLQRMLREKEIDIEVITNELEEIQCFIQWIKEQ
jgi:hypothetical protein